MRSALSYIKDKGLPGWMMLACVMDGHSNMQGQSGFFFLSSPIDTKVKANKLDGQGCKKRIKNKPFKKKRISFRLMKPERVYMQPAVVCM
jgi:hypothetical protein